MVIVPVLNVEGPGGEEIGAQCARVVVVEILEPAEILNPESSVILILKRVRRREQAAFFLIHPGRDIAHGKRNRIRNIENEQARVREEDFLLIHDFHAAGADVKVRMGKVARRIAPILNEHHVRRVALHLVAAHLPLLHRDAGDFEFPALGFVVVEHFA